MAEVGKRQTLPFSNCVGVNPLVGGGYAGCYAETGLRTADGENGLEKFLVSVGSLYEKLRLMLCYCSALQLLKPLLSFCRVYG